MLCISFKSLSLFRQTKPKEFRDKILIVCGEDFLLRQPLQHFDLITFIKGNANVTTNDVLTLL